MKILLVDDEIVEHSIMKRYLNEEGFSDLSFVSDGDTALEQFEDIDPNVIVCDTILPTIDGFELCRRIREKSQNKRLKIIITTGKIDAIDATKAREAGADDYVAKTSNYDPLIKSLKSIT